MTFSIRNVLFFTIEAPTVAYHGVPSKTEVQFPWSNLPTPTGKILKPLSKHSILKKLLYSAIANKEKKSLMNSTLEFKNRKTKTNATQAKRLAKRNQMSSEHALSTFANPPTANGLATESRFLRWTSTFCELAKRAQRHHRCPKRQKSKKKANDPVMNVDVDMTFNVDSPDHKAKKLKWTEKARMGLFQSLSTDTTAATSKPRIETMAKFVT